MNVHDSGANQRRENRLSHDITCFKSTLRGGDRNKVHNYLKLFINGTSSYASISMSPFQPLHAIEFINSKAHTAQYPKTCRVLFFFFFSSPTSIRGRDHRLSDWLVFRGSFSPWDSEPLPTGRQRWRCRLEEVSIGTFNTC